MAYNLVSLLRILDEILQPHNKTWILDDNHQNEVESLFQKVSSLKDLLENTTSHLRRGQQIEALESEIRDVSHEAEDIIEPNMVDQMLSKPNDTTFKIIPTNLSRVMEKFDAVIAKLTKTIKGQAGRDTIRAAPAPLSVSDSTTNTKQDIVVGFDGDGLQLKGRLTSQTRKLQIIPIVGMGGIGKTTLARSLYDDPLIRSHFVARAWVTVSQDHSVRAILLDLLRCIVGKLSEEMMQEGNDKLAVILYQSLYGRRYLVVVDDIWSTKSWDEIKHFFPRENLGSRILLTTRELNVAKYADSSCELHQMHLLNHHHSWELFQHKVFGKESCPPLLEGIGRKIVSHCGGLPLAISVIGGVLSGNENSRDSWDQVARDVTSVVVEKDENFSKILTLSYNNLPHHLRPCFLYMANVPKGYYYCATELARIWVAEGFLKPSESKNLEEAAEDYLQALALANRNLVSVREYRLNGKEAKSYIIHDLLRELGVRKARDEKFITVKSHKAVSNIQEGKLRRVSVHPSYRIRDVYASAEHMPLARSFLCAALTSHEILSHVFFALKLLRVLDVFYLKFPRFPEQVLQLVNLRFLALSVKSKDLPSQISRLRNLQTFLVKLESTNRVGFYVTVPSELWDIPELRHFKLKNECIILLEDGCYPAVTQENLLTLSFIALASLVNSGLLTKIPNIKKLRICSESASENANLGHLHNLEILHCCGYIVQTMRFRDLSTAVYKRDLPKFEFPHSIRKLELLNYKIPQSFMSTIGSLPRLRVLIVGGCSFATEKTDEEWELKEGEFESLLYLRLWATNLVRWRADDDAAHFLKLKHLVLNNCHELQGIPTSFGGIASLERIELSECRSPALLASARQIEDEQRDFGNASLRVWINE